MNTNEFNAETEVTELTEETAAEETCEVVRMPWPSLSPL